MEGAVGVGHFSVSIVGYFGVSVASIGVGCLWVGGVFGIVDVILVVGCITMIEVPGSSFVPGNVSI